LFSFLEGLGGYLSLGCLKFIQDEMSLSLAILRPVKTMKKRSPKAAKRGLVQQREITQNLQKTELETKDYELTKSNFIAEYL